MIERAENLQQKHRRKYSDTSTVLKTEVKKNERIRLGSVSGLN